MIPETIPVGVKHASAASVDAYGQPVTVYGPTVLEYVIGVGPRDGSTEPYDTGRDAVTSGVVVYSSRMIAGPRDRVVWPYPSGTVYDVDGEPADYRHGPFDDGSWVAGVVTRTKHADG